MNWVSTGSGNGLLPVWRQAITWTNAGVWSIGVLGTNFSEIWIWILSFSLKKMHLKMSSEKWRPYCPGGDELSHQSVKKLFSASLLFSKQNRHLFYSWYNHDFHINTFIHFIHIVKEMHKMSGKYLKKNAKLAWNFFFYFPVSFSKSIFN